VEEVQRESFNRNRHQPQNGCIILYRRKGLSDADFEEQAEMFIRMTNNLPSTRHCRWWSVRVP